MDECDGLAPVKFIEYRSKSGIAKIYAFIIREQADAIQLEHIERISNLFERSLDVGEGQQRKRAKSSRIVADDFRKKDVDMSSKVRRQFWFGELQPWRGQ